MPSAMAQDQEAATLLNVIALASLFYNTVESFGNIHSSLNDFKDENVLLAQLGVEQARLLIWGEIVGILSPPASLASYAPASKGDSRPRDERLDDPQERQSLEGVLGAIAASFAHPSVDEVANTAGLKPWQKGLAHALDQPAVDMSRVEGLEENYSHLLDVAQLKTAMKRPRRAATTQWVIYDTIRFSNFVKFAKRQVDKLVHFLDAEHEVENSLRADIKFLGLRPTISTAGKPSRSTTKDIAKLNLLIKACKGRYPALVTEAQQSLHELKAKSKEEHDHHNLTTAKLPEAGKAETLSPTNKRPGILTRMSTQAWGKISGRNTPTRTPAHSRPASPEPKSGGASRNVSISGTPAACRNASISG